MVFSPDSAEEWWVVSERRGQKKLTQNEQRKSINTQNTGFEKKKYDHVPILCESDDWENANSEILPTILTKYYEQNHCGANTATM